MGFLSSVTGFLGKVASGIGHVIAPGADFTPSGLLKEAGKLLPSLTEGIPGVGPLISKGISAVESVFGGSERSDPTEDTSPVTLPGLDEVKGMVASSQKAILDTREALNSKLTTIAKDLHGDLSKFKDDELTALHKIDVGIREKLDKEDFTLEKIYTDLHNTDEHLATVDEHVLEILKEARQSQSAILKKFEALNDLTAAEEDRHERERTHDRLRKKYEESQKPMTDAITWLTDHLSKFHSYISYENNDEIGDYLEVSGVHHTAFSGAHLDLRKAVEGLSLSLQKDFPPTQELLDLYAFGVHWLLIFDKLVLTLRYFHAHAVFNGEGAQKTEYTEVQRHWNEDLGNMIADAKKAAQFILGRPANGRQGEQTGFVEKLWQFRLNQIWKPQYYLEDKTLRNVWCFIDHYALHGVGAAKFSLARWRISRRCLFVVRCGRWHDADTNSTAREEENRDLKDEMDALYAGYVGLQTSYYQASTRPVLEMAHAWRASADHWKSIAPPHVPHASKNPPLAFQFTIPKHVEKAVNKARGKGLRDEDLDKGKGYPAGSNVEYAVSYVTAHGEGKMSSWEKANKGDPLSANWPSTLMMLELGPIRFQTPSHDDLVEKQDARDSDKRVTAPVVRRVYARHQGVIRHLIDVSAPIQKPVLVCDLGPSSKPEAVVVEQAPVRNNDEWYDDDEVASPHPYTTIAAAHLAAQPVGHLDLP